MFDWCRCGDSAGVLCNEISKDNFSRELFCSCDNGANVLVVAAHPDDEVIGLGAQLPQLCEATIIHVTNGAPADGKDARAQGFTCQADYAQARRGELESALRLAGVSSMQSCSLDFRDQETALQLVELTYSILLTLEEFQPARVITHPFEGGHPDHDATAFGVHAACRLLEKRTGGAPEIIEMCSYHQGPNGIEVGCFLPVTGAIVYSHILTEEERSFKTRLLACFKSQQETLKYFQPDVERFRRAPAYDFTAPPHPGRTFYDTYDWGLTSFQFRGLAKSAMAQLGLSGRI